MGSGRGALGRFTTGNTFGSLGGGTATLGFAVGNLDFLSSQASRVAKYYRSIEFGTHGFIGRELYGAWGAGFRGSPGGELVPFGDPAQQQFFPIGWTADPRLRTGRALVKYLRSVKERTTIFGVVKHEIVAQEAYTNVSVRFDAPARELAAIEQAFREAGLSSLSVSAGVNNRAKPTFSPVSRGLFMSGAATSFADSGQGSLQNVAAKFAARLQRANALLAEAFAADVAEEQQSLIKRKATSSGQLVAATLDARNRFPR